MSCEEGIEGGNEERKESVKPCPFSCGATFDLRLACDKIRGGSAHTYLPLTGVLVVRACKSMHICKYIFMCAPGASHTCMWHKHAAGKMHHAHVVRACYACMHAHNKSHACCATRAIVWRMTHITSSTHLTSRTCMHESKHASMYFHTRQAGLLADCCFW